MLRGNNLIKITLKQAIHSYNHQSALGHNLHKKLTLRKLSKLSGVSIHALSDLYNNNVKSIKLDNLNRLVRFFGGNISKLVSYDPEIRKVSLLGTSANPALLISTGKYTGKLSIKIKFDSKMIKGHMIYDDISMIFKTSAGNHITNSHLMNYMFNSDELVNGLGDYLILRLCPQIILLNHHDSEAVFISFVSMVVDNSSINGFPALFNDNKAFDYNSYLPIIASLPFSFSDNFQ